MTQITAGMRSIRSIATVPLTSNLSVHACPLASDSKAARVRRRRYSRVNIRAYASAIRVTRVCARVTSTRSTRERVSIASIPRPLPPRKKVEGLGTRLACPLCVNLVHAFERERVRFRVLASTRVCVCVCEYSRATRARHARAVKLLVSGTVGFVHRQLIKSQPHAEPLIKEKVIPA